VNTEKVIKKARKFAKPFRVTRGEEFRLKDVDPSDTLSFKSEAKPRASEALAIGVQALAELQDKLYAQDKWAVLLIFQAMDAAGKDGTIKHVMSGVNPQGCQVYSFKSPSAEDLDHDYLWRCMKKEQKRRFLERAREAEKNWKFSGSDMAEREHWDKYLDAYEDMIRKTATKHSPWYVVPADNKWFTRLVVAAAVVDTLASLDLAYPQGDKARLEEIASAKRALLESK